MIYIDENNIGLRKVDRDDLSKLRVLKDESWWGTHRVAILNKEDQERWFDDVSHRGDQLHFITIAIKDNRTVGIYSMTNIDYINRSFSVSRHVFKQYRGQGYGTPTLEAGLAFSFSVMNMHRSDTEILSTNTSALKCSERCGYVKEGVRREAVERFGQYVDSIVLGMLKEDWRRARKKVR